MEEFCKHTYKFFLLNKFWFNVIWKDNGLFTYFFFFNDDQKWIHYSTTWWNLGQEIIAPPPTAIILRYLSHCSLNDWKQLIHSRWFFFFFFYRFSLLVFTHVYKDLKFEAFFFLFALHYWDEMITKWRKLTDLLPCPTLLKW